MSQIWSVFKQIVEKCLWLRLRRRPQGDAAPWGGVIFQQMFENGSYLAHPVFKIGIRLFFSKFHHLVGDASYQLCNSYPAMFNNFEGKVKDKSAHSRLRGPRLQEDRDRSWKKHILK